MSSVPVWAEGLKKCGTYYDGYVEDLAGTLELHRRDTVSTWGVRRSQKKISGEENKENESASSYMKLHTPYTSYVPQETVYIH